MNVLSSPSIYAALLPHAPVLVPNIAGTRLAEISDTIAAMRDVAAQIVRFKPGVLILVSPHSPRFRNAFAIWDVPTIKGSLAQFGHDEDRIELPVALEWVAEITERARERGLHAETLGDTPLDHGAIVPLWFLVEAGWKGPTVVFGLPNDNSVTLIGQIIQSLVSEHAEKVAFIASGDMSHRLSPNAPCGFHPAGHRFDSEFIRLLRAGDCAGLRAINMDIVDNAAEDASQATMIALAAAGFDLTGHRVLSYEGPFGVGYGVAILHAPGGEKAKAPDPSELLHSGRQLGFEDLPGIARLAVEAELCCEAPPTWPDPGVGPLAEQRAVFVTLHTRDGALRGCIGSLEPQETNLIRETRHFALAAAFDDRRFAPVRARELENIRFSVTILGEMEDVLSETDLDPSVFGISIHTPDGRRAVLLPMIEGVDTVEEQLQIVRRKGRIGPDETIMIQRFRAIRFDEPNTWQSQEETT